MRKYLIYLALLLVGCGGSGDDDAPDDVGAPLVIPEYYDFFLGNLNNGELLTADVGGEFTVTVDIDGLFGGGVGDLDVRGGLAYYLWHDNTINLTVTSPEGSPLDGTFSVSFQTDIIAALGEPPRSGELIVGYADSIPFTIFLLNDGVALETVSGTISYTCEEFADLLDDEQALPFARHASLAVGVIEFLIEQFFNVADALDDLEFIPANNPYIEVCDMFTGTPPQGVIAQGDFTITWLGSGELSDGDDFTWAFTDCWSQDDEELLGGTVRLEDYTESVDYNTGVLFNIGFGGLGAGAPGGVIFDLTFSETVENQGVWTIPADDVITVSGGFVLNIQP